MTDYDKIKRIIRKQLRVLSANTHLNIIDFFPHVGDLSAAFLQSGTIAEHCRMLLHRLQY